MKFLRDLHDQVDPLFAKGGPLEKLFPLWEAHDTAMFTPGEVTRTAPHVRDGLDVKRLMITVVVALQPCLIWALYNTGYQAMYAIENGALPRDDWQMALYQLLSLPFDASHPGLCVLFGALYLFKCIDYGRWGVGFFELHTCYQDPGSEAVQRRLDSEVTMKRGLALSPVCSALATTRRDRLQLLRVR